MNYVILDLEWNQPIGFQGAAYRKVGDRLIFEMIQIGAVRVNDDLEIADSISIPIQPTCYTRIHPRIRSMTGLDQDVLADAPQFTEAMDRFLAWCGDDYTLITWGCDDVSVLQQNLDFFKYEASLPPLCDLQRFYRDVSQTKDRMSLPAAMEKLEILPDESRAFHNALNDAWYTAQVFCRIPDPARVLDYPEKPKSLIRPRRQAGTETFPSLADALASDLARKPVCPICGRQLTADGDYVRQSADKYVCLARCASHGIQLVRLRFRPLPDGNREVKRTVLAASGSTVAYVHTKRLQVEQKQREWLQSHATLPNPEEELQNAGRSSMACEDGPDR